MATVNPEKLRAGMLVSVQSIEGYLKQIKEVYE